MGDDHQPGPRLADLARDDRRQLRSPSTVSPANVGWLTW